MQETAFQKLFREMTAAGYTYYPQSESFQKRVGPNRWLVLSTKGIN